MCIRDRVGVVWAGQARLVFADNPNLEAMSLADPKVFIAVVTWAVYSFAMLARRMMGWTGRRAAWLSASGFAIVLLNFIGVSHRTAPVELREKLDFSSGDVGAAVQELAARASVPECVVLSTCNRSELYVANDDLERTRREVIDFLSQFHGVPQQLFAPHLFALEGRDAVAHLFRVAAGLESAIVGEPQILGQVKEAFHSAAERQCTGPLLRSLFDRS